MKYEEAKPSGFASFSMAHAERFSEHSNPLSEPQIDADYADFADFKIATEIQSA